MLAGAQGFVYFYVCLTEQEVLELISRAVIRSNPRAERRRPTVPKILFLDYETSYLRHCGNPSCLRRS